MKQREIVCECGASHIRSSLCVVSSPANIIFRYFVLDIECRLSSRVYLAFYFRSLIMANRLRSTSRSEYACVVLRWSNYKRNHVTLASQEFITDFLITFFLFAMRLIGYRDLIQNNLKVMISRAGERNWLWQLGIWSICHFCFKIRKALVLWVVSTRALLKSLKRYSLKEILIWILTISELLPS